MQSVNVAPVSLWGAQKVRLLCIYSTSCLSGSKRSVSSLSLCEFSRVLLCICRLCKLSSSVSGGHVSSDERAGEHRSCDSGEQSMLLNPSLNAQRVFKR